MSGLCSRRGNRSSALEHFLESVAASLATWFTASSPSHPVGHRGRASVFVSGLLLGDWRSIGPCLDLVGLGTELGDTLFQLVALLNRLHGPLRGMWEILLGYHPFSGTMR